TAPPKIQATLSPQGLQAVLNGDTIELAFEDGSRMHATLGPDAAAELAAAPPGEAYPVTLTPDSPLPAERAGQLATLRIVRALPFQDTLDRWRASILGD
ncbi:hypothetical protein, partial [Tropicimonas sediminicola]